MKSILEDEYPDIKKSLSVISSWEDHEVIYPIKRKNWFIKKIILNQNLLSYILEIKGDLRF